MDFQLNVAKIGFISVFPGFGSVKAAKICPHLNRSAPEKCHQQKRWRGFPAPVRLTIEQYWLLRYLIFPRGENS
jgi:hypothetical protein